MTPENPLEEALIAATTEAAARPTFYRLMLESPLFIIDESDGPPPEAHSQRTLEAGTQLRVATIAINGVQHTPIFSSLSRLQTYVQEERTYFAVNGRQLLEIVKRSHLVLNPGSDYGKQFVPAETAAMLSGEIFLDHSTRVVDKDTRVLIGQPAVYPKHITEALAKRFRDLPAVQVAYLAHCQFPETEDPPHTLVGIDARDDWERVIQATMETLRQVAPSTEIVDVVRIDDSELAQYMVSETKPFYKRKRLGLF